MDAHWSVSSAGAEIGHQCKNRPFPAAVSDSLSNGLFVRGSSALKPSANRAKSNVGLLAQQTSSPADLSDQAFPEPLQDWQTPLP